MLLDRILSGLVIGLLFIFSIAFSRNIFIIIILIVFILMLIEWYHMTYHSLPYIILGFFITIIPMASLILINIKFHRIVLLEYFIIIWLVDIFAMLGGKSLKGPKLAPYISPNKTWSGLIIGVFSAVILSTLITKFLVYRLNLSYNKYHYRIVLISIIALLAQVSDLFISFFKRKFGIKDSGKLIPGHGGVLDRFDSTILTAPVLLLICLLDNYNINLYIP